MFFRSLFLSSQLWVVYSKTIRGDIAQRQLGIFDKHRIIGGDASTQGRYPYAVSLQDEFGHFCGGSLIAPDVVLTAAHCGGGEYWTVMGRHELDSTTEGVEVAVKLEIIHPKYNEDSVDNDFMLLFLAERVTAEDVEIVKLSPDFILDDTDVTVIGWGDTTEDNFDFELAAELMEVEVTIISNQECKESESIQEGWEEFNYDGITDNMICAKDDGQDACQGDSGGPLVVRSDSGDIQVGVVSWGIGCAHKDFPGVYSRISSQYAWIKEKLCFGSSDPPSWFDCKSIGEATQAVEVTQDPQGITDAGGWTTLIEEDFASGFGMFHRSGNHAKHHSNAMDRDGVVAIAGDDIFTSNDISLRDSPYTRMKVNFSFYAIEMWHSYKLCLEYELDLGNITGEQCWSSFYTFKSGRWNDDMSLEFAVSDARSLNIRFKIEGRGMIDDSLIDYVTIQGMTGSKEMHTSEIKATTKSSKSSKFTKKVHR